MEFSHACALGGIAFSQARRLERGGTVLPAAYAAGCTKIAAPQLWRDDACGMDGKHGFIDVGNGRQKSLLRGFESVLRGVE